MDALRTASPGALRSPRPEKTEDAQRGEHLQELSLGANTPQSGPTRPRDGSLGTITPDTTGSSTHSRQKLGLGSPPRQVPAYTAPLPIGEPEPAEEPGCCVALRQTVSRGLLPQMAQLPETVSRGLLPQMAQLPAEFREFFSRYHQENAFVQAFYEDFARRIARVVDERPKDMLALFRARCCGEGCPSRGVKLIGYAGLSALEYLVVIDLRNFIAGTAGFVVSTARTVHVLASKLIGCRHFEGSCGRETLINVLSALCGLGHAIPGWFFYLVLYIENKVYQCPSGRFSRVNGTLGVIGVEANSTLIVNGTLGVIGVEANSTLHDLTEECLQVNSGWVHTLSEEPGISDVVGYATTLALFYILDIPCGELLEELNVRNHKTGFALWFCFSNIVVKGVLDSLQMMQVDFEVEPWMRWVLVVNVMCLLSFLYGCMRPEIRVVEVARGDPEQQPLLAVTAEPKTQKTVSESSSSSSSAVPNGS